MKRTWASSSQFSFDFSVSLNTSQISTLNKQGKSNQFELSVSLKKTCLNSPWPSCKEIDNMIAFQWDAYRPLVDCIPACTVPGGTCLGDYLPGECTFLGGVPAWGCTCLWGVPVQWAVPVWGVYLPRGWVYLPRGVFLPRGGVPALVVYLPGGCVPAWELYLLGGVTAQGVYLSGGVYLPWGCTCLGGAPARGGGVPAQGYVPARGACLWSGGCIPACNGTDPPPCEQNHRHL